MKKNLLSFIVFSLVAVFFIVGCASNSKDQIDIRGGVAVSDSKEQSANFLDKKKIKNSYSDEVNKDEENSKDLSKGNEFDRKRIITAEVTMETKKIDETIYALKDALNVVGGYVESSNITKYDDRTTANLVYRIPAEKLEVFKEKLKGAGNIINENINSDDITSDYYDSNSRLKVAKATREGLLRLLNKANKLSDIITLQEKLEDKNYDIDQLSGKLRMWDAQVSMSRYTIRVNEVKDLTVKTASFSDKIVNAFKGSWKAFSKSCESLFLGFIWILPTLMIFAIILLVVLLLLRRKKPKITND